jgi:RNA polymerase sigma factor (sigma-70 family)
MATPELADVLHYVRCLAKQVEEHTDGQLLERFIRQRDEPAFAALLQRHGPLVLRVCRLVLHDLHDAEDAFQATFLVLARKAASIHKQASISAWLHRVALNIARTARTTAAQRRSHEKQAVLMSQLSAVDDAPLPDWQRLLHEQVDRLPEKYRLPVVLCYLKGTTHEEAARQLGWPLGTVKGRLARARDLLRGRLARRGLALSTSGLAAALTQSVALGQVPPALLGHTLRVAVSFAAAGATRTWDVSAQAVALANGALHTMPATKLAAVLVMLSAIGVVGLAVALGHGPGREARPGERPVAKNARPLPPGRDVAPNTKGEKDPRVEQVIQLTLASARQEYRVGEGVDLTLTIKNNGKGNITLHTDLTLASDLDGIPARYKVTHSFKFDMTGPDGHDVRPIRNPVEIGLPLRLLTVRPGETAIVKERLRSINLAKAPGRDTYLREKYYPMEAPGVYRLRMRVGDATSNELKVTIVDKGNPAQQEEARRRLEEAVKEDLHKLEGTWHMVGCEEGGKAFAPENVNPNDFLTFSGTTFFFKSGQRGLRGTFTIDPSKNPKWMDQTTAGGVVFKGIYDFRGDKLRVFLGAPGGERPTEFRTKAGEKLWLRTFARVKAREDGVKGDLSKLQGGWQMVGCEEGGKPVPPEDVIPIEFLSVSGTTFFLKSGLEGWKGNFTIDPSKDPKWIDQVTTAGLAFKGVYELKGDTLRVLLGAAGGERPRELTTRAGEKLRLRTYARVKAGRTGHGRAVYSVALSADARRLITGSGDGTAILWETATGKRLQTFPGHAHWVFSVALSADGTKVVTGSHDKTAILWDTADGSVPQAFEGHSAEVSSVALSSDGQHVLTGSWDDTAILWNAATGKKLQTFRGHTGIVTSVALSADGKKVVTGSTDKTAVLWDAATGEKLQTFRGHASFVFSVALSIAGNQVVTGSEDRTAMLWEVSTGKQRQIFRGHTADVHAVALSPDGKHVLTGSRDRTAILWEAATGMKRQTFEGHTDQISSVALTADGKRVATGSYDRTAILWDAATGKKLQTFQGRR